MGVFGAVGGLLGWGVGILFNLRPSPQQEARNLITAYEQIEQQKDDKLAEADMVEKQMTPDKQQALEADKKNIIELADRQVRGVKRDGRGNSFFELYIRHREGEVSDDEFT